VSVTPAKLRDGREGPAALPYDPGDVFADSACRGQQVEAAMRTRGGVPPVAATAMWGRDEAETLARLTAQTAPIQRLCAWIEKIFGTWRRCDGAMPAARVTRSCPRYRSIAQSPRRVPSKPASTGRQPTLRADL
jgi:hypothetical protein